MCVCMCVCVQVLQAATGNQEVMHAEYHAISNPVSLDLEIDQLETSGTNSRQSQESRSSLRSRSGTSPRSGSNITTFHTRRGGEGLEGDGTEREILKHTMEGGGGVCVCVIAMHAS